jgi:hypothetical protein
MTQTAVEYLFIQLYEKFEMKGDGKEMNAILEQAKEMEKKQIIDSYKQGQFDSTPIRETDGEQYFNLIFNQPINK